ncbi:3-oxoacyl-[acyl-carrier protein] reductase [Cupriavidus sp. YR651]|uniref:SDR family NAD(P)-dependent oxidoreductase n=1 Tax=Cupriavidus sp. YR651 TaxID=1855315 RepID=UPI000885BF0C|nr:SDR family oxidoreductase [Cupriavidus sp. YR651]SDD43329.1 3-oxoacyl-[acyl-carrier protein] reductase [Cupriavidus sp. YR651]
MHMNSLSGKVAVILGGSGGIGFATGSALAELGVSVVLTGRNADRTERAVAALSAGNHLAASAEVSDSASLRQLADDVRHHYGRADILVNTSGFTKAVPHADLDALDDALIDELFAVNWRGQFAAIRAFAPLLRANADGLVVNVGSIAGRTGQGSNVAYCAAKAGLDVMAMSLGRALAPEIRVLNVSPGVVDTAFVPGRDSSFNDRAAKTTPLKRIGQPRDVADAIVACATSLRFATGTTIVVDGGRQLG